MTTGAQSAATQQSCESAFEADYHIHTRLADVSFSILAVLAVSFDILFLVQHYILYRHSNAADSSGKSGARGGEEEHGEEEEREPDERTRLV